jgi:hypothetical protein
MFLEIQLCFGYKYIKNNKDKNEWLINANLWPVLVNERVA